MRYTLPIIFLLAAVMASGCPQADTATTPTAPKASAEDKAAPTSAAQTFTRVEAAFKRSNRPFKRIDVKVSDEQLEGIVASGYEVFESTVEPKVRVFVFQYDAKELVKPAKVSRWINGSGLIHNGQTSANGLQIIVAGTAEAGEVDEETNMAMNDFMDAFMMMR